MGRAGFIIDDSSILRAATTRVRYIHFSGLIVRRIAGVELCDAFIDPTQSPLSGSRFRIAGHDALREDGARSWITRGRLLHTDGGITHESAPLVNQFLQAPLRA
jgi:hypothetical protein